MSGLGLGLVRLRVQHKQPRAAGGAARVEATAPKGGGFAGGEAARCGDSGCLPRDDERGSLLICKGVQGGARGCAAACRANMDESLRRTA